MFCENESHEVSRLVHKCIQRYLEVINLKCPTYIYIYVYVCNFKKMWTALTDFHRSSKNQISLKSVEWEPRRYIWTDERMDKHDEAQRHFSRPHGKNFKIEVLCEL
jgi:hypothetical protein